jgi:outer membrane protein OmpA-like peptidoglycan-associated protein
MGQIYNDIKGLISSKMIATAATTLNEEEPNIKSAVATILPALLGRMLSEGTAPHVTGIIEDAGKDKLINQLQEVFKGHGIIDGKNYGERMENALIGAQNSEFPAAIADKKHIKAENANRLTNWISAVIAAYLGEQVVDKKKTMVAIMQELQKEKSDIAADIPNDMYAKLGLGKVFGTNANAASAAHKTKGMSWIWWIIIILLVLILLFFMWRSCERKKDMAIIEVIGTEIVATPNSARNSANDTIANNSSAKQDTLAQKVIRHTLPDGQNITIYQNSSAAAILAFLNSDNYKNASEKDLRETWFDFENINFVQDSPDQLTVESMEHVNNLIEIMQNHNDVKMEIGVYADTTGTRVKDSDISRKRAEYLKSLFVTDGIDVKRIAAASIKKELAIAMADTTDTQQGMASIVAIRFRK